MYKRPGQAEPVPDVAEAAPLPPAVLKREQPEDKQGV